MNSAANASTIFPSCSVGDIKVIYEEFPGWNEPTIAHNKTQEPAEEHAQIYRRTRQILRRADCMGVGRPRSRKPLRSSEPKVSG
jgi:adenylosuccinate synthase